MRFSMSTNISKLTDVPPVAVDRTETACEKTTNSKKCVIGVISAILIVCLSLAAILIGVYFFVEGEKNLVKELVQLRDNTQVERKIDLDSNIVQYYIKVADYEQWTVDDLNNYVEMVKIETNDGAVYCFVYPLNDTSRTDMNQINQPLNENKTSIMTVYFHVSRTAIPDTSFLSKTARDLCNGISIYWVTPACPGTYDDSKLRVKRKCHFWCWVGRAADVAAVVGLVIILL